LRFFEQPNASRQNLLQILGEFKKWNIPIENTPTLALKAGEYIYRELQRILKIGIPNSLPELKNLRRMIATVEESLPVSIDFWKSQNLFYSIHKNYHRLAPDQQDKEWGDQLNKLGTLLRFRMQQ
jgi:hypothetical protein